jgi:peroxiredoxin
MLGHERISADMTAIGRRAALLATLAAGLAPRKPHAAEATALPGLKLIEPPVTAPEISFMDADGKQHGLKEYHGSGVVLNLWATWCAPCVAELPSLDALARALAAHGAVVLALSSDRGGAAVMRTFYDEHGIRSLPVLLDPHGTAMHTLGVRGIPVTYLIDPEGMERAYLQGGGDWGTDAAAIRVRGLMGL